MQPENPDPVLGQPRPQMPVPAIVLLIDEIVRLAADAVTLFHQRQSVGRALVVPVFNLLHEGGDADFKEFVEVARRDRQEL